MAAIPCIVHDLLQETRYGVSFPCDSGCQMRFKQEGKDLGGFYPYSQYGGVREAVIEAIADNQALREKYRRRPDGRRHIHFQRIPHGTTGVVGISCGSYYDSRRDTEAFRYQVSWRKYGKAASKTFHLAIDATADQHLHAFRTALQFRKEWEVFLDEFDPTRYKLWRTHRLYGPGHPTLPSSFWGADTVEES